MADKGNNSGNRLWSPVSRGWGVSSKAEKDSSQTQNQAPSPLHSNDATYSQLKEYEARRRLAHSTKFDSMSLYWKSYRDLLAAAIVETGRTHRLVLGTCRAHQAYADAMSALHEDVFLDEKGNVANEKQQKILLSTRKAIHESQTFARGKSVLSEIKDAQHVVASQFGENARNMDEEIAETIGALLNDVKQQFSTIEELGSSVLVELEKTEVEVTTAWERYLSKANSMSGTPTASSATSPQETAPNGVFLDIWVRPLAESVVKITASFNH